VKLRAKWIIRILKRLGKNVLRARKKKIIALINDKVDLPKMNEAQEEKLLEAVYDAILDVMENL
jgi:lauroyl/myristoyl acyltransferase